MKGSNADHGESVFPEMSLRRRAQHAAVHHADATSFARVDDLNIQNPPIKFIEMTPRSAVDKARRRCGSAGLSGNISTIGAQVGTSFRKSFKSGEWSGSTPFGIRLNIPFSRCLFTPAADREFDAIAARHFRTIQDWLRTFGARLRTLQCSDGAPARSRPCAPAALPHRHRTQSP
ncbi:hypothetical protein G3N57_30850 [Paraburkholderia sp. Se-20369]|nr:hypothetical protein [Paraburkholderia sp. Se-20369]